MTLLEFFALLAGIIGIIGSIVPGLPGPPISWIGLLLVYIGENAGGHPVSTTALFVWLVVMILVTVLDYVIPAQFTKMTGGSRAASWGAIVGLFAGLFIPPIGIILGSLIGAFVAEMMFAGKDAFDSAKASFGVFVGFVFGTGLKLIVSGLLMYYIVVGCF